MGYSEYNHPKYLDGRPWAICDRCSYQRRHDTLRKEWTGLLVCDQCLDPRPAQLTAPVVFPEGVPIRDPRPDIDYNPPIPDFLAVFNAVRAIRVESPGSLPNHFPFNPFPLEADFLAEYEKYRDGE